LSAKDAIELEGVVVEALKGGKFIVKLNDNDMKVTCVPCGKIKMNKIRILEGDKVTVELSPYSLELGRITWRTT
jgi:translation initiation factor IF-1